VFENDRVRVLHIVIPPGDTVPLHTHRLPAVLYVEHWSL
jgi:quercetin dioxygenase-like cupin family protein